MGDSVSYGSQGEERVFGGLMSGCWVRGAVVKLEMVAGLWMFFPQECLKYR